MVSHGSSAELTNFPEKLKSYRISLQHVIAQRHKVKLRSHTLLNSSPLAVVSQKKVAQDTSGRQVGAVEKAMLGSTPFDKTSPAATLAGPRAH